MYPGGRSFIFRIQQIPQINLIFHFPDRSTTKGKTFDPCWNETFIHEVTNAKNIGLTVFHDAAIPPDDFVANCTIAFEDLAHRDKEQQDFWVSVREKKSAEIVYLLIFHAITSKLKSMIK